MDTLKVCISWVIACLNESFKACLHKCANTATKNCLLTEEVSFSFCTEGCFKNACSCSTDTESICKTDVKSIACCVLMDSDKTRNTLTYLILGANCVTRTLRSNHDYIYILWWLNASEMNVEAVCECESLALCEVWLDAFLVKLCLLFIVDKNHNKICVLCSISSGHNLKTCLLCLCPALASLVKTYDYINA